MMLSVIIPVFNEAKTITSVLDQVLAASLPDGVAKEIVVVDDGSTDGTRSLLNEYQDDDRVALFYLEKNQGKSAAVREGLRQARGDVAIIQDADLEYDPVYYQELIRPIMVGDADVVYGSRFMGDIKGMKWINRFANRTSNITINALYGVKITDFHTCFKMFKRSALDDTKLVSERFTIDTEMTVQFVKKGIRIHEIPIAYQARERSDGKKITWATALEAYWYLVKHRFV